ncbi:GNAT family N-acetyltransferase [Actinokineospora fastidiosa]|uniref:N-acetyltransferase domain-containing protein n=1 Tax=Actinokineospora fastidiosa TaxID=1816 RepID=A0A918G5C8_9PSEU|nr:GNAT family N-acetyltransferase [Actinokineospora fastidiosa]GGS20327.1 hypothetical protein GCM10010171_11230 [Actinokineospora fastidiosa]
MEIIDFEPDHATEADLAGFHELSLARLRAELPEQPEPTPAESIARVRVPAAGFGPRRMWLARLDGRAVGWARVYLPPDGNSHVAMTDMVVHPQARRLGVGTALLSTILRAVDRPVIEGPLLDGGDGALWAESLGLRRVHGIVEQRLEPGDARTDFPAPDGYHLRAWSDAAPDDLLHSYASARTAIQDAPLGELAYREPDWTAERIRAEEAELRASGVTLHVVVALHGDEVVGLTVVLVYPDTDGPAHQRDTAVVPAHRGKGLGVWMKAAMLRRLPGTRIATATGIENVHMRQVNERLGFTTLRTWLAVRGDRADLLERLRPEIAEFDHATDADLAGYHAVMLARQETDRPDEPPLSVDDVVGRLRTPFPGLGPVRYWVARVRGTIVGLAVVYFPEHENSHLALVDIVVHPRFRNRGIGTGVLRAMLPTLRAEGRTTIEEDQVTAGSDGERWALGVGLRVVHAAIIQKLVVADTDPALWDVPVPEGYRLHQWSGEAPDELVDSYAAARAAMVDAPLGDMDYAVPAWSAERQREHEAGLRARGVEQRVVVAVRDGAVVGLTEVELHPHRPTWSFQRDTSVVAAHRGRGLGRAMKAHMLRWLVATRPDYRLAYTGTGAQNVHMARVNHQLGFRTVRELVAVSGRIDGLSPSPGCPA